MHLQDFWHLFNRLGALCLCSHGSRHRSRKCQPQRPLVTISSGNATSLCWRNPLPAAPPTDYQIWEYKKITLALHLLAMPMHTASHEGDHMVYNRLKKECFSLVSVNVPGRFFQRRIHEMR